MWKKVFWKIQKKIVQTNTKYSFRRYKKKKVIASNKKGDPTIYKIDIVLKYNLLNDNITILSNEILKQATYNNIDDKFELLKYEENIIKNLSKRFADDVLISLATLSKW